MGKPSTLNHRIFQTILVVGFSSLLPKAALVARDLLIANHYGTGDMVDAFLAALSLPSLLVQVIVQAFASALIPVFMQIRHDQGDDAARHLSGKACSYGLLVLVSLAAILALLAPWIIATACPGFGLEKRALAVEYFLWLVPLIALQGYVTIGSALLNAQGRFALTTLLPSITPLLVLASLLLPHAENDISPAVFATLGGAAIEMVLIVFLLHHQKIPLWHRGSLAPLPQVARQALPMIAGMALINANLLIDQAFASLLGSGSVAALAYGNKVPALVLSLAALPLGTAVLPHFSRHAAERDWVGLRHSLHVWSMVCLALSLPVMALLMWFSRDLVQILFERGKFSAADVTSVTLVQICYLGQIPGYMLGYLGSRMATSLRRNGLLLRIACGSFVLNSLGDYCLMQIFGLPGIAITTAITYSCSAAAIVWGVRRALPPNNINAGSARTRKGP